jgi:hypothetical protein
MDKGVLLSNLAATEQQILNGDRHLVSQRELIHKLERAGYDKTQAETLLGTLKETQNLHMKERERLRNLLRS